MSKNLDQTAKKAISLLDLTNLNDDCTKADIEELCTKAQTEFGNTAAICIWPRFVAYAKPLLQNTTIQIATVVNFPAGSVDTDNVEIETRDAIAAGADEIDLVFPYEAFLAGDTDYAADQISRIKAVCGDGILLKVIIETGELKSDDAIRSASFLAIKNGADFIKTSTGKVAVNATLHSARLMLQAIADSGKSIGFKPAGGIKTTNDAADYLILASEIMGENWANSKTLRFGASSVLNNLLATLKGENSQETNGY